MESAVRLTANKDLILEYLFFYLNSVVFRCWWSVILVYHHQGEATQGPKDGGRNKKSHVTETHEYIICLWVSVTEYANSLSITLIKCQQWEYTLMLNSKSFPWEKTRLRPPLVRQISATISGRRVALLNLKVSETQATCWSGTFSRRLFCSILSSLVFTYAWSAAERRER